MIVRSAKIHLYAAQVHTLKEKRQILRSLVDRLKRKYPIAIAEVDAQEQHQQIIIGIACVSNQAHHAQAICDQVIRQIDQDYEVELISVDEMEQSFN